MSEVIFCQKTKHKDRKNMIHLETQRHVDRDGGIVENFIGGKGRDDSDIFSSDSDH